jgi:hypothetical protein
MPATSIKQQQAMGIARGIQKGEIKPKKGSAATKIAKNMKPGDVKDFASTKHKGLPKKAKKPVEEGAIDTLYMVKKPYSGCQLTDLVKPIDPLVGLSGHEIVPDQVHCVFPDQEQAQSVAERLHGEHQQKMAELEEKKNDVTDKINTAIEAYEEKRKHHVDAAKADPKNAGKHKEHIAHLATKIDDLMSKLEKVERSKKSTEDKKGKETIKENEEPKGATSTSGLVKAFRQYAQDLTSMQGISAKEIGGIEKLINTILSKASAGEIALAIDKAQLALDNSTKNIGGKPAMPAVPKGAGAPVKPAMPTVPKGAGAPVKPAMPTVPKKSGNFSLNNNR